jgi:hypothetical protein
MTLSYWLIFFTTSCFANLMGLNISAAFNSAVTIYILIPFFIIPQLLFSGVLVKFEKLNQSSSDTGEYVPLIGNMMAARWSFEALAVEQFSNNRFERNFFKTNIEKSQNDWYANFLIPNLKKKLWECRNYTDSVQYREKLEENFHKLIYHIDNLSKQAGFTGLQADWKESLSTEKFNSDVAKVTENYLDSLAGRYKYFRKENVRLLDSITKSIVSETGKDEFIALSNNYKNKSLEDIVLDRNQINSKTIETDSKIVQKFEPVYMKPTSKNGQAHFYAPYKLIGSIRIDTYWFNIIVMWVATFILYIVLYYNYLQKAVNFLTFIRGSYIRKQKQL